MRRESQNRWRRENPDKVREQNRRHKDKYIPNNRKHLNEYHTKWRKNNPEKVLSYIDDRFNRWAMNAWSRVVRKRDGYMCTKCGSKEKLHAHHVLERAKYPEFSLLPMNEITVCHECHWNIHREPL